MIGLAFKAIQKRINSSEKYPKLYVDWYLEQDKQNGDHTLYETPAIFLEFKPSAWSSLPNGGQESDTPFEIHIITEYIYGDGRVIDPKVSDHTYLMEHVYKSLQNVTLTYNDTLESDEAPMENPPILLRNIERTNTVRHPHTISNIMKSTFRFRCKLYDLTGSTEATRIEAYLDKIVLPIQVIPGGMTMDYTLD